MQGEVISDAMKAVINLFDDKSFVEIGEHENSGIICGYGTIKMRPVCLFAQDSTVNSGAINEINCQKICNVIDMAEKNGIPLIGMYDSKGVKITENTSVLLGLKKVLTKLSNISGVIPIISVLLGDAVGISSLAVNFSDFIFMIENKSKLFINGPQNITVSTGKEISSNDLGGAKVHSEKSGICDVCTANIEECTDKVKELLDYLPDNNLEDIEITDSDDLDRICEGIDYNSKAVEVINSVVDNNKFFEIKKEFSRNVATGFARIGGRSVGIIANKENKLNIQAVDKMIGMIKFCDSFNMPLVTLTNCEGTDISIEEEQLGISKKIANLIYAYCDATVTKINIIIGNMFGGVGASMGIGADINLAWNESKISVTTPKTAVNVLYSDDISNSEDPVRYRDELLKEFLDNEAIPKKAQESLYVDGIISPFDTRKRIISTLELYAGKREHKLPRKHGNK